MIKVSVIVPVYNVEKYLAKCLDSLVNQTLKEIEIIVVNDGSTDSSGKIAEKYQKKYPDKIKLFVRTNHGLGATRNFALTKATGEYIGFLDSDDSAHLEMYETMYNEAIKNKADLLECDILKIYPDKEVLDISNLGQSKNYLLDIKAIVGNKLVKKSLIDTSDAKFTEKLRYEDICFTNALVPKAKKIIRVAKPFFYYLQRSDSISNYQTEKIRDIMPVLESFYNEYQEKGYLKKYRSEVEYLFIRYLLGSAFKRATQVRPKNLRYKILKEQYEFLKHYFPEYKKNCYLKNERGLKNKYFRYTNYITYQTLGFILSLLK